MRSDAVNRTTLAQGTVLSERYRIVAKLGEGGMGEVYEAEHVALGRPVAIKVIAGRYANDREAFERFAREARSAAAIGHPGIVDVLDFAVDGELAYFAMELLHGEELGDRAAASALTPAQIAGILLDLAEAVGAAHERGIVHRDLKPANVFLARAGRREVVKVLDFGVAKLAEAGTEFDGTLTRTGQVVGTPLYMSPEQLQESRQVTPRSDVYSIGVIGYELLTGRPPFQAGSYGALVLQVMTADHPPVAELVDGVPLSLAAVVERAMARNPSERFADGLELAAALEALLPLGPPGDIVPTRRSRADRAGAEATPGDVGGFEDTVASGTEQQEGSARERPASGTRRTGTTAPRKALRPGAPVILAASIGLLAAAALAAVAISLVPPRDDRDGAADAPEPSTVPPGAGRTSGAATGTGRNGPGEESPDQQDGAAEPAATGYTSDEPDPAPATPPPVLDVQTSPRGATVRVIETGASCQTPCPLPLPETGDPVRLIFTKTGYERASRRLAAPYPEELSVRLKNTVIFDR